MEKTMKARVQHKHDIEANWLKATNFTPLASEIIVYDPDENYDYPRIKIGDGKTNINILPFVTKDYAKEQWVQDLVNDSVTSLIVTYNTETKKASHTAAEIKEHYNLGRNVVFCANNKYLPIHLIFDSYVVFRDIVVAVNAIACYMYEVSDSGFVSESNDIIVSDVQSVNGKTGVVSLTASDVGALPSSTTIPTKTSQLMNDSGFINSYTETDPTVPAWAKADTKPSYTKTEIGLGKVDNVKQYSVNNPPIVAQSGAPTDINVVWIDLDDNTMEEPTNEGNFVSYNKQSLTNAQKEQARMNIGVDAYVTEELAKRGQMSPEYAESKEWLNANGETTKMYVLPDGFIYAYTYQESTGSNYTNLAGTITYDRRLSSSGKASSSAAEGAAYTDFIPIRKGQTLRIKNFDVYSDIVAGSAFAYMCFYTGASESQVVSSTPSETMKYYTNEFNGVQNSVNGDVVTWTAFTLHSGEHSLADSITHVRISGKYFPDKEIIVTVDEEITEGGSTGDYGWVNTGHAFVPADYEAEILALQKNKADKTAIPTKLPNPNALTIDGVRYDGSAAVNIETQSGGNILYGKKWVACGDSFTHGGYNASDGFDEAVYIYQDGRFTGHNIVYPYIIGLRNNMNIVNLATGGQTMANSSNSFMTRYTNIDADADYITIMLGINDKIQGIPVGTLEDTVNTTFCGAFNIAMEHILENHPFAHIGIMVSHGTNEEIMEATRGIAERWGVPYLDYGSPQVPLMNRYTGRNVCAKAQQIREKNFYVISDGINVTNGHPNTAAHEYESTFIEAWLRTL